MRIPSYLKEYRRPFSECGKPKKECETDSGPYKLLNSMAGK
jgi:hypothetical protein